MEVNVCTMTLTRCVHLYRHLDSFHLLRVENFLGDGCSAPGDPAGQAQGGTLGSFRRFWDNFFFNVCTFLFNILGLTATRTGRAAPAVMTVITPPATVSPPASTPPPDPTTWEIFCKDILFRRHLFSMYLLLRRHIAAPWPLQPCDQSRPCSQRSP